MLDALCSAFAASTDVLRAVEPAECCGEEKAAKETLRHHCELLDPASLLVSAPSMATLLCIYASLIAGLVGRARTDHSGTQLLACHGSQQASVAQACSSRHSAQKPNPYPRPASLWMRAQAVPDVYGLSRKQPPKPSR